MIENSKGTIYYGMHFYPGVAEYREPDKDPFRVFLNEDTIRSMDPTFAGRPVFVQHVDDVDSSVDKLRHEADGWVIESFFNQADGKHWVKFIVVTERGNRAIKQGMRLSNAYEAKSFASGGMWNGVDYDREIKAGEYEHLAIVPNPRYEESVILTPDQFKQYNEDKLTELQRLKNHKDDKESTVAKFSFFKRAKVENAADLEEMMVTLPKSKHEASVAQILNEMDDLVVKRKGPQMADGEHLVEFDGKKITVNELVALHNAACVKKNKEDEADEDARKAEMENDAEDGDDMENEEDEDEAEKKKKNKKKNEVEEARENAEAEAAKAKAKAKADRLRNASERREQPEGPLIEVMEDQVARGRARYGS